MASSLFGGSGKEVGENGRGKGTRITFNVESVPPEPTGRKGFLFP